MKISKSKNSGLSVALLAAALGISLMGVSQPAQAQFAVLVTNCIPTSGTAPVPNCASEMTLTSLLSYTMTGVAPTMASASPMDDGTVGQQRLLNDALAKLGSQIGENVPNADKAERVLEYQKRVMQSVHDNAARTSANACQDATIGGGMTGGSGGGSGGGSSGGGGGSPLDVAAAEEKTMIENAAERATQPRKDIVALEEIISSPEYCTAGDVRSKFPKCGAEGAYAGADSSPGSIFLGAVTSGPSNESFEKPEQRKAAAAYIRLAGPRPAPNLEATQAATPQGAQFMAYRRRYVSRSMASVGALAFINSQRSPLPANHPFITDWNSSKGDYAKTYPGRPVPNSPSMQELTRFYVMRQFTQEQEAKDQSGSIEDIASRQLTLTKYQNLLLMQMIDRLDRNNMLQAQVLANQIDPVSYATMSSLRSGATSK